MIPPPIRPAIGMVITQLKNSRPTRCQLTALYVPLHSPTPTVAPVIHIEVETGSLYWEKIMIVIAAPISIDDPRDGEWYVSLLPMTEASCQLWSSKHSEAKLTLHDIVAVGDKPNTDGQSHNCNLPGCLNIVSDWIENEREGGNKSWCEISVRGLMPRLCSDGFWDNLRTGSFEATVSPVLQAAYIPAHT